jgi:hypothetical protein
MIISVIFIDDILENFYVVFLKSSYVYCRAQIKRICLFNSSGSESQNLSLFANYQSSTCSFIRVPQFKYLSSLSIN